MQPLVLARELWRGHRYGLMLVGLLLLVNIALAVALQGYLAPAVDAREQLLIRRQADMRSGTGSEAPAVIYAQGIKDLGEFEKRIPPHREFTGLINELYSAAAETTLELTQISYNRKQEQETLLRYTLAFSLTGRYADIKKFIHLLEQSPRLMLIEKIGLQGEGREGANEVRLQMNVSTFFRTGSE